MRAQYVIYVLRHIRLVTILCACWFVFQMKRAVQFLHDLGTIQYFDNDMLKDYVIINPQWIVDIMTRVVSVNDTPIKVNITWGITSPDIILELRVIRWSHERSCSVVETTVGHDDLPDSVTRVPLDACWDSLTEAYIGDRRCIFPNIPSTWLWPHFVILWLCLSSFDLEITKVR